MLRSSCSGLRHGGWCPTLRRWRGLPRGYRPLRSVPHTALLNPSKGQQHENGQGDGGQSSFFHGLKSGTSGNGIVPARAERVTAQQTPETQPESLHGSFLLYGLVHVNGAGRLKTARTRQYRGNEPFVTAQEHKEKCLHRHIATGTSSPANPAGGRKKFLPQFRIRSRCRSAFGIHDEIEVVRDFPGRFPKYLPEQALDTITYDCAPHLAGYRDSETVMTQAVAAAEKHTPFAMELYAGIVDSPELRGAHDPEPARECLTRRISHSPSVSCALWRGGVSGLAGRLWSPSGT